jgi:Spy/CpxP family protein refolding chaperone
MTAIQTAIGAPTAHRFRTPVHRRHTDCHNRHEPRIESGLDSRMVLPQTGSPRTLKGGRMMVWPRLAITAFTVLVLASGSQVPAQENANQPQGNGSDRLEALSRKLNFSDEQKQQVKQIYADFDHKAGPLIRQLCTQRGEEWQALQSVLNKQQREKLAEVLKAQGAKEMESIAQKLSLNEEQKAQIEKIRKDFWNKFLDLSVQKPKHLSRAYRELHMEVVAAGRAVLTPEQREKLAALQKQDFEEWHDHIYRQEHLKALGEQLGLSSEQVEQLQKLIASHEQKLEEPKAQLKQLCKAGCADLDKALNADQKARFHEVFPFHFFAAE